MSTVQTPFKPAVQASYELYIGGRWQPAATGRTFPVHNPASGEMLAEVADAGRDDTRAAIEAAKAALRDWSRLTGEERGQVLARAAALMRQQVEHLAQVLTAEQGKPLAEARTEVNLAVAFLQWYAEEAKRVYGEIMPVLQRGKRQLVIKQPIGVVGAITPWNFPALMVTRKISPALAAGCTVVLKPAEQTPLTALEMIKIFDEAGLPPGVLNLVTSNDPPAVGEELLEHPDVRLITFTGSTEVGRILMRGASHHIKKVALELGGHAPLLVFKDANLDKAVAGAITSKYRNAGQTCICANRVYVQEDVLDDFAARFAEASRQLKVGPGWEEGVQVGPLINRAALEKVTAHVEDAVARGAKLETGGRPYRHPQYPEACFFEPTVLSGARKGMRILEEETFGPVVPIIPFTTEEEAIRLANDSPYGLAGYVFTENLSQAVRVAEALEFGIVGVNDVLPSAPHVPFGGIKTSGIGKEGGHHGIEEFLEEKLIVLGIEE